MKHKQLSVLAGCVVLTGVSSTVAQAAEDDNKFELYGVVEVRSVDKDDTDFDTFLDAARIGMKGTHGLEKFDDLNGRWQMEFNLPTNSLGTNDTDNDEVAVRKAQVSLQGGFGELILGRQNNGLVDTKKMDTFKNDSGVFLVGPDRVGNAISYVTPTFSGLHAYGQIVTDAYTEESTDPDTGITASGEQSDDVDATVFGVNYSNDNLYVGLSRYDVDEFYTGEVELTSLGFSASFGDFGVFGTFQDESYDDYKASGLGVSYAMNDWTFKVGHRMFEDDANLSSETADTEGKATHLLASYSLAKNVGVFVQYLNYDGDAEDAGYGDQISVGIHSTFSKLFTY